MRNVEYTLKISSFHSKKDMQPLNQELSPFNRDKFWDEAFILLTSILQDFVPQ